MSITKEVVSGFTRLTSEKDESYIESVIRVIKKLEYTTLHVESEDSYFEDIGFREVFCGYFNRVHVSLALTSLSTTKSKESISASYWLTWNDGHECHREEHEISRDIASKLLDAVYQLKKDTQDIEEVNYNEILHDLWSTDCD